MVSNQDGLGTPAFPLENFLPLQQLMLQILEGEGVRFDEVSIAVRSALPSTGGCGICAAAMMTFFKQSEGVPMQTINLKQYYPFCKEDIFVEVSDEIVEAFLLDKRAEAARDRKMFRYKAFCSLDCNDGIENAAIGWAQPSPEDHLMLSTAQKNLKKGEGVE